MFGKNAYIKGYNQKMVELRLHLHFLVTQVLHLSTENKSDHFNSEDNSFVVLSYGK